MHEMAIPVGGRSPSVFGACVTTPESVNRPLKIAPPTGRATENTAEINTFPVQMKPIFLETQDGYYLPWLAW